MTIPPEVREFDTYILAYSGGRDSTAALFWCLEHLPTDRLHVIHNPTGAAWPMLPLYLEHIADQTGVTIQHARAGDRPLPPTRSGNPHQAFCHTTNLLDMIRARGKWPSYWQRYCTQFLKVWPLRLYAAQHENPLLIMGERAEESKTRARLPVLGPDTAKIQQAYQRPIFRPVLHWSTAEVQACLARHSAPLNPVYAYSGRCNCWCCPMTTSNKHQILAFMRLFPDRALPWVSLEKQIQHTWRNGHSLAALYETAQAQPPLLGV